METENKGHSSAKADVRQFFARVQLSDEKTRNLEKLILASELENAGLFRHVFAPFKKIKGLSYVATAVLAASVTFLITNSSSDESDIVTELATIPATRSYPPDFDLEGDASAFPSVVEDVFPADEGFVSNLPTQIQGQYLPSEGRFFTWAGGPAVSIRLKTKGNDPAKHPHTMLYIVKLSGKSDKRFPHEKTTRRVSLSGKERKVQLWREGKFGYAVVQNVSPTE